MFGLCVRVDYQGSPGAMDHTQVWAEMGNTANKPRQKSNVWVCLTHTAGFTPFPRGLVKNIMFLFQLSLLLLLLLLLQQLPFLLLHLLHFLLLIYSPALRWHWGLRLLQSIVRPCFFQKGPILGRARVHLVFAVEVCAHIVRHRAPLQPPALCPCFGCFYGFISGILW